MATARAGLTTVAESAAANADPLNTFLNQIDAAFALETPTAAHIAATAAHGATGAVMGTTNSQTVTNKTFTTGNVWNGGVIPIAYLPNAAPTITLGTAAAVGSASTFVRTDATVVAFDGTAPTTQAIGDAAAVGSVNFAARRDHKHAMPAFATNAFVLGTAAAAGSATTVIRSDSTIALFEAAVPTTVTPGGAATAGSAAFAARRDHGHAMSSTPTFTSVAVLPASGTGDITGLSVEQDGAGGTIRAQVWRHNDAKRAMFRLVNAAYGGGWDFVMPASATNLQIEKIGVGAIVTIDTGSVAITGTLDVTDEATLHNSLYIQSGHVHYAPVNQNITGNNQTVTVGQGVKGIGNVGGPWTGLILGVGTHDRQVMTLFNYGTSQIAFAATPTSKISIGTLGITAQRGQSFVWDAGAALWYPTP